MSLLKEIFDRQNEYYNSLLPIYHRNGFDERPYPYDLNDRRDQEKFRLLAWRFTEELVEALYASMDEPADIAPSRTIEEMADAWHFFVELCLATDISFIEFNATDFRRPNNLTFYISIHLTIEQIGKAMMALRQRPWRTDFRVTNKDFFKNCMRSVLRQLCMTCAFLGLTPEDIHKAYFAKSIINEQRRQDALK